MSAGAYFGSPSSGQAYRVTAEELSQIIQYWESLQSQKDDLAELQKEVMSEAKARGYDIKVLKMIIALRKKDRDEVAEQEAILQLYKEALGM